MFDEMHDSLLVRINTVMVQFFVLPLTLGFPNLTFDILHVLCALLIMLLLVEHFCFIFIFEYFYNDLSQLLKYTDK